MAVIYRASTWFYTKAKPICFWLVAAMLVLLPVEYLAIQNAYGPSTDYFNQHVSSAARGADGRNYIYIGDEFNVSSNVIRHKTNGSCRLAVWRVREDIGGFHDGRISLIQYADEAFVGDGEWRQTSWPVVHKDADKIIVKPDWIDDPRSDEQSIDVFVIARYYCNILDGLWPRWLDSAASDFPSEGESKHRYLAPGLVIPYWDEAGRLESEHTRVILKRKD
jgi:hypothetical protein